MGRGLSAPRFCSICGARHHSKGLCQKHYQEQRPRAPKSKVNTPVYKENIDYEDFWLWVKKELKLG